MAIFLLTVTFAHAQTLDPFSPDFRLSTCDGPALTSTVSAELVPTDAAAFKAKYGHNPPYVACDFAGLVAQAQFLINAMIMLGILAAVISFTYAGILYLTGSEGKIKQAKGIFKKVGIGFLIMLGGWTIVYQILVWLQATPGTMTLLGK